MYASMTMNELEKTVESELAKRRLARRLRTVMEAFRRRSMVSRDWRSFQSSDIPEKKKNTFS